MTLARGTFTTARKAEPPYDDADGVSLARMTFDKTFVGGFEGSGQVAMIAAGTPVKGSAGYVGVERLRGKVDGKAGSFVVLHTGLMNRGAPSLTISIVPDSGTGELAGIAGVMTIDIVEGVHHYTLDYTIRES